MLYHTQKKDSLINKVQGDQSNQIQFTINNSNGNDLEEPHDKLALSVYPNINWIENHKTLEDTVDGSNTSIYTQKAKHV